jgi:hypothetical protein
VQNISHPWRIKLTAAALVSPLILAPGIATSAMLWARYEAQTLHPDLAARRSPTVSRAIADPAIGDIFAVWMLLVAALQAFAVYRIMQAIYRTAIVPAPHDRRPYMMSLLVLTLLGQASGIVGVVTLSQYTGSISDDLHQLGSYLLFVGNGFSIAFCGVLIWLDHTQRASYPASIPNEPAPYHFLVHTRFAGVVSVIGIVFGILYYANPAILRMTPYVYRLAFAMCELVLLIASLVYLACFVVPMYRHERHLLTQRRPEHEPVPAAGEA